MSVGRSLEVIGVFAERRIVGHEADDAALGELAGVVKVFEPTEAGRLVFADRVGLVEAEDRGGGSGARRSVRHEQPRRHPVARLGRVAELAAQEDVAARLRDGLDVERDALFSAGERAHHQLHPPADVGNRRAPLGGRFGLRRPRPIGCRHRAGVLRVCRAPNHHQQHHPRQCRR